jgi:2-polyprenyl-6-methoxyphenol hydroxylase-like FAD-dependent oxidoreductase
VVPVSEGSQAAARRQRDERTTCCVVGGGPAGIVLGLLLARGGVDVTVLEKHADFLRDFRGDTVHPSTLRLLDELGLGERFASLPQSRVEQVVLPLEGGGELVVADFRRLRTAHPYIAMVPQWDLLDLLADAARAEPSFGLRMESEVVDVLRDGDRIAGVVLTDAEGRHRELRADLTVACDGRTSVVRARAGLAVREFAAPLDVWWFRLPRRPDEDVAALMPRTGRSGFAIVIPREGYFQIAYVGRKGSDAAVRAKGIGAFRTAVAELLPDLADRVDALTSMDDVKFLDVRLDRLRRWYRDGLLCIGDAAHAMSPVGGVGINLAVQDAVAAATLLRDPLQRNQVRIMDLARVQRRRIVPTVLVQGMQRVAHRLVVRPALAGRRSEPPRSVRRVLDRFPALTGVTALTARFIAFGVRPEHAPAFARRAPEPVRPR